MCQYYMEMKNISEKVLIERLRHGSSKAFDDLYDLYFSKVYAYCLQISKSQQKAADITQDVFLKLWETRKNIKSDTTLSPYLFSIARNFLISAYRDTVNSINYEAYVRYCSDKGTHQTDRLEYSEFLHELKRCLDSMPQPQQEVLRLRRFKDMTNKQIADYLGISEQTVKNRMVMALKYIRDFLRNSSVVMIPLFPFFFLITNALTLHL